MKIERYITGGIILLALVCAALVGLDYYNAKFESEASERAWKTRMEIREAVEHERKLKDAKELDR